MIGDKILEIRNDSGLSQKEFAEKTGISYGTYQNYEYGNQSPRYDYLTKISQIFNIPMTFFLDDNGSSIVRQSDKNQFVNGSSMVRQFNDKMPNNILSNKFSPQTLNDDIVSIPFYEDIRASAGSGAYNEAETAEQLNFPKSFLRQYFGIISFNNLSIIIGSGDSMFPTLPENCYLVIQQGNVKEGEICVARIEDELYVKRLQKLPKLKLFSDNKTYEPIELEGENFEIIGRVVGYFKKTSL